jgi:hypothetical protein
MLTAGPVSKMASQQEKAFCVLRFEVSRSVTTVQRDFHARGRKDAPCRINRTVWYRQFVVIVYLLFNTLILVLLIYSFYIVHYSGCNVFNLF